MATLTQDELNKLLWSAADSARGVVDGGVFKDYILRFCSLNISVTSKKPRSKN